MREDNKPEKRPKPAIFLNNLDLGLREWDQNLRPGFVGFFERESDVNIVERELGTPHSLYPHESGLNSIRTETFGDYVIYASAVKYLANTSVGKRVLFSGNIQVYKEKLIAGPQTKGLRLLTLDSGKILCFSPNNEKYAGVNGLHLLVFGNAESEEGKERRIEAILRGYRIQEEAKRVEYERFVRGYRKSVRSGVKGHPRNIPCMD